jgi:hypothetical protein
MLLHEQFVRRGVSVSGDVRWAPCIDQLKPAT